MSIILDAVCFSYGEKNIFEDFSMNLEHNTHTVILGRSGCGKTTFLKLLTRKLVPEKGSITGINGKTISVVFQEDRLIAHLDAISNVRYVLHGKNIDDSLIEQTLMELGIYEFKGKPVRQFSGGMKRRVAICRALLYPSDILILDEPFRSLDVNTSLEILPTLQKYFKDRTVISVLHQKDLAIKLNANIINL